MVAGLSYFVPGGFTHDAYSFGGGGGGSSSSGGDLRSRYHEAYNAMASGQTDAMYAMDTSDDGMAVPQSSTPSSIKSVPPQRQRQKTRYVDVVIPTTTSSSSSSAVEKPRPLVQRDWMYESQQVLDETSYVTRLQRVQVFSQREDYYASTRQHNAEVKITGEDRFNLFVFLVRAGFVWRLKKFQLRFFELIMQTMSENIFGPTWSTEGERMMKKHGWRSSPKVCAASAPRRFGKTVTLSVVMCAYALVMPGKIQSVFSTGSRASGGLRDLVRKTLEESGMRNMLLTRGTQQETVLVRSIYNQGPQFSTMNFYPSDEKVRNV